MNNLKIKIYADGANLEDIFELNNINLIKVLQLIPLL